MFIYSLTSHKISPLITKLMLVVDKRNKARKIVKVKNTYQTMFILKYVSKISALSFENLAIFM